jgi:hypothetical protein
LIEAFVALFNEFTIDACGFRTTPTKEKNKDSEEDHSDSRTRVVSHQIIYKILLLVAYKYPVLLFDILNHDVGDVVHKFIDQLEKKSDSIPAQEALINSKIFATLKKQSHISFLSYYLRVVNYLGLDKSRNFLVEIVSCLEIGVRNIQKELVPLGQVIGLEIIAEMERMLAEVVNDSDFLRTSQSAQSICSASSLLVSFV